MSWKKIIATGAEMYRDISCCKGHIIGSEALSRLRSSELHKAAEVQGSFSTTAWEMI